MDNLANGPGNPPGGEALTRLVDLAQLFVCDLENRITFWNRGAEQLYGWSQQEALGRLAPELLQTRFPQPLPEIKESLFQAGSWEGELTHIRRDGTPVIMASRWILHRDEGGTPLAILEINNDITRLKRTEAALRTAHLRNTTILNNMADGFFILDPQWRLVYANNSGVSQMRKPREELLGRKIWELFPDIVGTELQRHWERVMAERVPANFEYHYAPYDTWFEHRVYPAMEGVAIFTRDITGQKQAEQALRESEERFRVLADSSPVLIWVNDREGAVFVNRPYLEFVGANPAEVQHYDWVQFVHPEDREAYVGAYLETFNRRSLFEAQFRFRRADGEYRWMKSVGVPRLTPVGEFLGYVGSTFDITDLKQIEAALRLSEERFAKAFQASPDSLVFTWPDSRIFEVNDTFERMFGFSREEALGKTPVELQAYVEPAEYQKAAELFQAQGFLRDYELKLRNRAGEILYCLASTLPLFIHNEPARLNILRDVTRRKQAEAALQESHERLASLLESISDTFTAIDREWRISYVNSQGLKVSGVSSPEEIVGKNFWELYPQVKGTALETAYRQAMEERVPARFEVQGVLTGRWYETTVYPYADGISIFGRDITDRKQMEESLRFSEERFAKAFQASPDVLVISAQADDRIFEVNDSFEKLLGYSRAEALGKNPDELKLHVDLEARQRARALFRAQGFLRDFELKLRTKAGEICQFSISTEPLHLGGTPYLLNIMRDITEQKQAELALQARERDFRAMFELSGSGTVQVDPVTGRFLRANRKYCEFTGYSEAELLTMTAPEVAHPEDRQREIDLVWPVRQGEQDHWEIEKRYLRKDGRVVWGLVTGSLIRDEQGQPLHTIASVQDITALKEAEAEIRRLREGSGL